MKDLQLCNKNVFEGLKVSIEQGKFHQFLSSLIGELLNRTVFEVLLQASFKV